MSEDWKTPEEGGSGTEESVIEESVKEERKAEKKNENASEQGESAPEEPEAEQREKAEEKPEEEAERESGEEEGERAPESERAENEPVDGAENELLKKRYEKELSDWKDKYTRLYAEFDNYRKRTEREKSRMFELGAGDVIEKLLPIADNFERALDALSEEEREEPFEKGVDGIYRQLRKLFSDLDVKEIEAEGKKFDPALHNAVMADEEGDAEEGTITADLQKGYTFRGSVIRHSMVKVKK